MVKKLTRDKVFYAFAADLEPVLEIEPGEKVQMETHDCFCGQIQAETDTVGDLDWARVNPATLVATVYSALTIDKATDGAIHRMAQFLTEMVELGVNEAGMIMSLAGAIKFCQVVDPNKTVRFEFPQSILSAYGFDMGGLR